MNIGQAYRIIGITNGASLQQVEQAYKACRKKLQLQLRSCMSPQDRRFIEQQIQLLTEAWDFVCNHASAQGAKTQQQASPSPLPLPISPPLSVSPPPASTGSAGFAAAYQKYALIFCLSIAAFFILLVCIICFTSTASFTSGNYCQLRVLSVPWCYVEINGKAMGTSGQPKAFKLTKGIHTIMLQRNGKILTKDINLIRGDTAVMKVQFDRGHINVDWH